MALRKIATIGHPILRQPAREISREELMTERVQSLIDDLIETMRDANGAGLAAIQVHEPLRIAVIEVRENPRYPYKPPIPLTILVNPKLEAIGDETFDNYEGCLSVPNLRGLVKRYARVRARAWDRRGNELDFEVRGLSAGTFQHEVDHLDGLLFVDRVTDPRSLSTWENFDRFYRNEFVEYARTIIGRYGS
ncbi:MAG: peptide deformylase [Sandaracinaceae bacterium]|nr:peptide deformylase [Sandaracinaceae bacterium]